VKRCNLCPRRCKIDRSQTPGACTAGNELLVGSIVIHRGEEPPLIKGAGSGAIFLCGCPLKCSYCQNRQISHLAYGQILTTAKLASYMVELQNKGCSNINLVTASHYTHRILEALEIAADLGLILPIVFNSGGYESITTLELWKDHGDIYLMDLKYGDNTMGRALSNVGDYWDRAREAIAYLWDMIGPLRTDHAGRAVKGLIVRHLVLPGMFSNPFSVLEFLAGLSLGIPVSIMSQYNPVFYQGDVPQLKRSLREEEYAVVLERAIEMGFTTIFLQDMDAPHTYVPDFHGKSPFGDYQKLL
jgi:putative pyruvate formate lyase activating enzyme